MRGHAAIMSVRANERQRLTLLMQPPFLLYGRSELSSIHQYTAHHSLTRSKPFLIPNNLQVLRPRLQLRNLCIRIDAHLIDRSSVKQGEFAGDKQVGQCELLLSVLSLVRIFIQLRSFRVEVIISIARLNKVL